MALQDYGRNRAVNARLGKGTTICKLLEDLSTYSKILKFKFDSP